MSAWKACDIRGVYPEEVYPDLLSQVALHLASQLPPKARIVLAGDYRASTAVLKDAACCGLLSAGALVLDAGQVPTPVAYFAHRYWGADAIIIITASHNPANHNGLKFAVGHLPPTEEQLAELRESLGRPTQSRPPGAVEKIDPVPAYTSWITNRWEILTKRTSLKLVLDAGNGAWSRIGPAVTASLGHAVTPLFCEIDGSFPSRPPDCAKASNLTALSAKVREVGADLGVAWDGDGDRVAFVDDRSRVVTADQISLLLARHFLCKGKRENVVYDIKLTDVLRRLVESLGGVPLMERSGHTFLKRRMIIDHCLLGCEASGHYFYRELGGSDDGLFTALLLTSLVAEEGSLDHMLAGLPTFYATPDLRLPFGRLDYEEIVARLRGQLRSGRETSMDGFRMENDHGVVLVRRSVTEPVVSLRIEGFGESSLQRLVQDCLRSLPEFAAEMEEQMGQAKTA